VAERRQRGNENFWHGSMLGEWPRSSLEVLWRSGGDCRQSARTEAYLVDRKLFPLWRGIWLPDDYGATT
jgi:hypothetical protein